jgi:hypothetical protein
MGLWGSITGSNAYLALARVRARLIRRKRERRRFEEAGIPLAFNCATLAESEYTHTPDWPKFPSQRWRDALAESMELFPDATKDVWIRSMIWALRHERNDEMVGRQIEQGVEEMLDIILDQQRRLRECQAMRAADAPAAPLR